MITERDFWNHRSHNYDEQIGPLYERAYQLTAERTLAYLKPEDRVLDFACGTGIVTLEEAPHVKYIRAIDISDEMAAKAKQKMIDHGVTNVEVTQTDLFDPCLEPDSFDVVTAFNVLCYVENSDAVLARIKSLLKPGGRFKSHTGSMPYVAFYKMKELERRIADAGFTVLERENLFPAPPNLFVAAQKK